LLGAFFFRIDSRRLSRWFKARAERAGEQYPGLWEREISIGVHDWAVWWRVWTESMSWHSKTPRWRDGGLRILPFPGSRVGDEVVLEENRFVELDLPEGKHLAVITLSRVRCRSERFPLIVR